MVRELRLEAIIYFRQNGTIGNFADLFKSNFEHGVE